ncbi:MAG TPA: NAD(P)/FAD-dependent oxidoreductase [Candidatus Butyricicoccus avistercoris]|uniref:NAD(P)/FAD-dependent oxidoreductase n=1 Tax=Candidatus Butyricicoccus avistercoris TaxID=2838518 RepID=A0A9D1PHM4_9FIRM|nr:NAD(P)/FAD-dependent oxidoreductase [Candidatus Butyricicoccus avistercoris]
MPKLSIAVIGAGAAGLIAAGTAASLGADVLLFETNPKVGRKIYITGKGRCNVTNNCEVTNILANIPVNPRFLYSALGKFNAQDVMSFFESLGVPLKTERGNRVFPVSDKASDIVDALFSYVKKQGVKIVFQTVNDILEHKNGFLVKTTDKQFIVDRVIITTGGASYPNTGSTGDGYRFAKNFSHSIVSPRPSLVPLVEKGDTCQKLMGLSLKNVRLTAFENNKKIFEDFGEMLFTHFGVSGPLVLSASAHMRHFGSKEYKLLIDLKPALDEKTLDKRLLNDFEKYKNSDFINALGELLPRKLIPVIIELAKINPHTKVHSITKTQRATLCKLIKAFPIDISGARPIYEAIVTTGGVSVKEINPKTMESKKKTGLYFAGEVIDVDAYTGGFNLQIAWSTGKLAGVSASERNGDE